MNALIRKETRLLLPAWVAALLAATSALWNWGGALGLIEFLRAVAILVLVLSSFGKEISLGTFGLLLVQPAERRRLWQTKVWLLAAALVSVWVVFVVCSHYSLRPGEAMDYALGGGLALVLAFSGGLWSSLLLRDMVSALFSTCMMPFLVWGLTFGVASHWMDTDGHPYLVGSIAILVVYAIAGYFWARRLFIGAEDVPWTGGQISLRPGRGLPLLALALECRRGQGRWMALLKKEIQLQEITMALVPMFGLLSLAALALHHFTPEWHTGELVSIAIPSIWLAALPWVIGAVTVAEERRLNTLEGLFCLPVSRRASFFIKLAVTVALGIILGGLIPWCFLRINGATVVRDFPLWKAIAAAALIAGLGFYASTMSRGLLQALPMTFGVLFVMAGIGVAFQRLIALMIEETWQFMNSSLFPTLAWPTIFLTIIWLAYRNFGRLQISGRLWLGNIVWAGGIALGMTLVGAGIFNRDWQLLMRLEPHHGPARIEGTGRAVLAAAYSGVAIVLPDGRLWVGRSQWPQPPGPGTFVAGSDWKRLAAGSREFVALKSDGTLWRVGHPAALTQIGRDADWKEITGDGATFLAVKQNGTLWGWGVDQLGMLSDQSEHADKPIQVPDPIRIQEGTDWVNVFHFRNSEAIGAKSDGTLWRWGFNQSVGRPAYPLHKLNRFNLDGTDWQGIASTGQQTFALEGNGTLWKIAWDNPPQTRVGAKSDWISLHGDSWHLAALEASGTLWSAEWNGVKHPSRYSDWIAADGLAGQTWALARDGTLTGWRAFGVEGANDNDPFLKRFTLGPNRRPFYSGNIFSQ